MKKVDNIKIQQGNKTMSDDKKATQVTESTETETKIPQIKWNDSKMTTTYSNAVNASSTREEVSVFFGTNQSWNGGQGSTLNIELSNRIVLNPYAAKRLSLLLSGVVGEYEKRFGELKL
jgi:hypothetical protein